MKGLPPKTPFRVWLLIAASAFAGIQSEKASTS
jgi:hypothetical protein